MFHFLKSQDLEAAKEFEDIQEYGFSGELFPDCTELGLPAPIPIRLYVS